MTTEHIHTQPDDQQLSDEQLEQISGGKTVPDEVTEALQGEATHLSVEDEGGLKGLFRHDFAKFTQE